MTDWNAVNAPRTEDIVKAYGEKGIVFSITENYVSFIADPFETNDKKLDNILKKSFFFSSFEMFIRQTVLNGFAVAEWMKTKEGFKIAVRDSLDFKITGSDNGPVFAQTPPESATEPKVETQYNSINSEKLIYHAINRLHSTDWYGQSPFEAVTDDIDDINEIRETKREVLADYQEPIAGVELPAGSDATDIDNAKAAIEDIKEDKAGVTTGGGKFVFWDPKIDWKGLNDTYTHLEDRIFISTRVPPGLLRSETKFSNVEHQAVIFDHFMNKLRNQFLTVFENKLFIEFTNIDNLKYKFKPFPLTKLQSENTPGGAKENGKTGNRGNESGTGSSEKEE